MKFYRALNQIDFARISAEEKRNWHKKLENVQYENVEGILLLGSEQQITPLVERQIKKFNVTLEFYDDRIKSIEKFSKIQKRLSPHKRNN